MPRSLQALRSLKTGLSVLAVPGMYLVYKYTQYRRQQQQQHRKKATEKELQCLNHKIDKLLTTLDEHDAQAFTEEEECVVCLCAKATMQTFPCGHTVVCRKCFVKTIQVAVSQRCLPLRCVVCRTRIYKLKQSRDCSPLTPPPSRHHMPWHREHLSSPSNRPHQKGSGSGGRSAHSSSSFARQIFHGGSNSSNHQIKRSDPDKSGTGQPKPVATKIMQPLLIFPQPSDSVLNPLTPVTALKKDCVVDAGSKTKKQVRFASPVRYESPTRGTVLHVDIITASQCHYSSPKHILRNSADRRIPTISCGECFSPRLARGCARSVPKPASQTHIFGSPRLVFKHCK